VSFAELLTEGQVVVDFSARDKAQAVAGLTDVLAAQGRLTPIQRAAAVEALLAREKIGSTGLEHGIALPHAIVDIPGEALAVLAVSREGVQKHLRTLAEAAKLLDRPELREALLQARSAQEVLRAIRDGTPEAG
jgi:nitrogen PTS system EIIA component